MKARTRGKPAKLALTERSGPDLRAFGNGPGPVRRPHPVLSECAEVLFVAGLELVPGVGV